MMVTNRITLSQHQIMEEFIAFLNAIRPVSAEAIEELHRTMKVAHFRKNQFLIKEGTINDKFFFICKGLVRCYYDDHKGQEISKWVFMKNDVVASTKSYRTQRKGVENMVALKPCTVVYTTFPVLEQLYSRRPELEHHARLITQKYSSIWYDVLDGIRMKTAKQRVDFLCNDFPDLAREVPVRHLAALIDMNRTTFIKMRSEGRK
jgi:signal-transduction protein with cAMP-binding, CBS, and nucleotidyltransferase domain